MKIDLLPIGSDDPYFRSVFESLLDKDIKISNFFSSKKIPEDSILNHSRRVDSSNFYHPSEIGRSFNFVPERTFDTERFPEWFECERFFLSTMDRLTACPAPISFHRELFRELVFYFFQFFELEKQITHVFFSRSPHFGWDIVLFYVARALKKTVFFIQRTDLDDSFIFREHWASLKNLETAKGNDKSFRLSTLPIESKWVQYSNAIVKRQITNRKLLHRLKDTFKEWFKWFILFYKILKQGNIRFSDSALFQVISNSKFRIFKLFVTRYFLNKKLLIEYKRCSGPIAFEKPYIYFAMHFQPERSTQPEGLEFEDQILAIGMLSKAIPEDWNLIVKEHPRQFDKWPPDLRKLYARKFNDYERILSMKNTILAELGEDSNTLIQNAIATATITGTTGWEGLKQGIPSIVFGLPWYSQCESCFPISNFSEAKVVIQKLRKKSKKLVKIDVDQFLVNLSPNLCKSSLGGSFSRNDEQESNALKEDLVNGILDRLTKRKRIL